MNILFITISWPIKGSYNLYSDLMLEFVEHGHSVYAASISGNSLYNTCLSVENGVNVLRVSSGSVQRNNKYIKVINSFMAGIKIRHAVVKYFHNISLDLIIFTTPPITMILDIIRLKHYFKAPLYLLLKDIWPQDTVDIGGMRKGSIVWSVFRWLEKKTYKVSDYIGCMSPASKKYILKENTYIDKKKVEVCPNSQKDRFITANQKVTLRSKYGIPEESVLFIYGGNIGIAQGIDFLFDIAREVKKDRKKYLMIVGGGTEFERLDEGLSKIAANNVSLLPTVDKYEYDMLVSASDVGLILLHPNAEVPNFPSRLLSYIHAGKPVISAVDEATDIGDITEYYGCGRCCRNGDIDEFVKAMEHFMDRKNRIKAGENARKLFMNCYTTEKGYNIIIKHFEKEKNEVEENEYAFTCEGAKN